MSISISRTQFLRGDFSGRRASQRPPWAVPEARFVDLCTRCNACADDCPRGLLRAGAGGYPVIDFSRGGCSFCGECVDACAQGALTRRFQGVEHTPWRLAAHVEDHCLSLHGVLCRVCGEHCGADAIRFRPELGGRLQPLIDAQACNGCGTCYAVCPSHALAFAERATQSTSQPAS
ncbi:MAG: ferredoxin-type protein NapF [Gammaproteobacteria bacterium]|nr:ferredoxin-type protein NapF [Gammaproteobacteria bacterium]